MSSYNLVIFFIFHYFYSFRVTGRVGQGIPLIDVPAHYRFPSEDLGIQNIAQGFLSSTLKVSCHLPCYQDTFHGLTAWTQNPSQPSPCRYKSPDSILFYSILCKINLYRLLCLHVFNDSRPHNTQAHLLWLHRLVKKIISITAYFSRLKGHLTEHRVNTSAKVLCLGFLSVNLNPRLVSMSGYHKSILTLARPQKRRVWANRPPRAAVTMTNTYTHRGVLSLWSQMVPQSSY